MNKKIIRITQEIDLDTGELIKETKERLDYRLLPFATNVKFSKQFHKKVPPLKSYSYHGMLSVLARYLEPYNNKLVKDTAGTEWLLKEDCIKILGISFKTYMRFTKACIDSGVMVIDSSTGEHYINPAYYLNGNKITLSLYSLFRDNVDTQNCMSKEVRDIADKYLGQDNGSTELLEESKI